MKTKFDGATTELLVVELVKGISTISTAKGNPIAEVWAKQNARLFAASPDLLKRCVAQYHWLGVARIMLAGYADLANGCLPSVIATAKEIFAELRATEALLGLGAKP